MMRRSKLVLFLLLVMSQNIFASDTVRIKTSAQCESCKNRLESRLSKMKGIVAVQLDLNSKDLIVEYQKEIVSPQAIEVKVTEIGYDANGRLAKKAAYKRLPACCRKDYKGEH